MEPLMTKTIVRVLGLSALLVLVGCYNTNSIKNGGLVCGTGGTCPSGFECRNDGQVGSAGHCWKNGTPTDAGSTSNPDAGPVCTTAPEPGLGPFTNNCSAKQTIPNSTCDPVCQSDCPCYHRCVLEDQTNTSFKCEDSAVAPGTIFVAPLARCACPTIGVEMFATRPAGPTKIAPATAAARAPSPLTIRRCKTCTSARPPSSRAIPREVRLALRRGPTSTVCSSPDSPGSEIRIARSATAPPFTPWRSARNAPPAPTIAHPALCA